MSKIPYLFRRGNVFYFRAAVPPDLREDFQCREIVQSLKVEKRLEAVPLALRMASDVTKLFNKARSMDKTQKRSEWALREKLKVRELLHQEELEQKELEHLSELRRVKAEAALKAENEALKAVLASGVAVDSERVKPVEQKLNKAPLLSVAIDEFLCQYDQTKKDMLRKHKANLPVFLGLMEDRPVDQIRHIDVSRCAAELCKFPARRTDRKCKGMTPKQMIAANDGECLHKKSFENYKSSVKALIVWAREHYENAFEKGATSILAYLKIKHLGSRSPSENNIL